MTLKYHGTLKIPAKKAAVWAFVTDARTIAENLPDNLDVTVEDDTHFQMSVPLGFGFVRGTFRMRSELLPDPSHDRVDVHITGHGLGSLLDFTADAELEERDGVTVLTWQGLADARGTVAMAGEGTVDQYARRLLADAFAGLRRCVVERTA